jgi:hypothetical protein
MMNITMDYLNKLFLSLWFLIGLEDLNIFIMKIIIFILKQAIMLLDKD